MADTKNQGGLASSIGKALKDNPATQRLADEAKDYAEARGTDLVNSLQDKLGSMAEQLEDQASGGRAAGKAAAKGAKKLAEGESPAKAGLSSLVEGAKEKAKSIVGKGGGAAPKMTNIIEEIDIGLPISVVYNQWTQYEEFSSFMKGVESVDPGKDVESTWRLKVFKSRRSLKATTTEQVPDRRIAWTSEGAKGSTKGVVTFHPLADDLTRVLLVLEYYPAGFFEKTGNIWRAPGRRARLDLKHFRRYVSMRGEASGSWRGEIHDSEITKTPEEVEEEDRAAEADAAEDQETENEPAENEEGSREEETGNDEEDQAVEDEESDEDDQADEDEESDEEDQVDEEDEEEKRAG